MIAPGGYVVLGGDGKEYGPVDAGQIRQWIAEERLEKKSPVKPPDAKDWVFLGSLPEFAETFAPCPPPPQNKARPAMKWWFAVAVVILAGVVWLALKKIKPH
jgi:hypothetical protein